MSELPDRKCSIYIYIFFLYILEKTKTNKKNNRFIVYQNFSVLNLTKIYLSLRLSMWVFVCAYLSDISVDNSQSNVISNLLNSVLPRSKYNSKLLAHIREPKRSLLHRAIFFYFQFFSKIILTIIF